MSLRLSTALQFTNALFNARCPAGCSTEMALGRRKCTAIHTESQCPELLDEEEGSSLKDFCYYTDHRILNQFTLIAIGCRSVLACKERERLVNAAPRKLRTSPLLFWQGM